MAAAQSPRQNGWTNRDYSPRRQHMDAQRRQIDLEQAFNDLRIRNAEVGKLDNLQRRIQTEEAELKENSLAKIHQAALEKAKRERDIVRQQAEAVLQQHLKKEEERRRLEQEQERQRLQAEAEAKAAGERARREEEERKRLEQERIRAEADAKAKAERQRQEELKAETERLEREQQENEQKRQQQQQAREQKEREDTAQAEAAKEAERKAEADARANTAHATVNGEFDNSAEKEHEEYLALYFKLKKWRGDYWDQLRADSKSSGRKDLKDLKTFISEARQLINIQVGQLNTGDKAINKAAEDRIINLLKKALQSETPMTGQKIPVNFFLPTSLSLNDNDQTVITDQAGFLMCWLAKRIVVLIMSYVHGEAIRGEPIGTMVTKVFGLSDIQYARQGSDLPDSKKSQSLIPILLAKYHKVCPGLFGITARQDTLEGMRKLGWSFSRDANGSKSVPNSHQDYFDRTTGLARAYASFALRNASASSKIANPYPPKYFWKSLAQLVNLPPEKVQPIHLVILQNIFGHEGIKRFLLFFGDVGIAALREAYVEFLGRLPDSLKKDLSYKQVVIFANDLLAAEQPLHLT